MAVLQPLLLILLHVLLTCPAEIKFSNGFFYQDILRENIGDVHWFTGVKLKVSSEVHSVFAMSGSNVTLPCWYWYEPPVSGPRQVRVKWSWFPSPEAQESDVLVAIGDRQRSFRDFKDRVFLQQEAPGDISLIITHVNLNDSGQYRCEVIDGLEDESTTVDLELRGVVYPYQPPFGHYRLTFTEAQKACEGQDSAVATFKQLVSGWQEGLDWCNAGWLADGTVHYPITQPRQACGGLDLTPGIRSYGSRHRRLNHYDVFCFSSILRGKVYYLQHPQKLNFTEAVQACIEDGALIAKVGHLYAAWKFMRLDRCDAGWLADGSIRYPIINPRPNCGPTEPGVRSFGFPSSSQKHGVYCYSAS
ncbi:hyaluronan and proteoglycan link protein 3-like isoform X1 [Myxocyprinus asiaticus]|uniref:hyaluronan and proteoglycan link protein 3-like isoform X1 n=1 Tax=Myxocyprinus asiaticus TaxID=70543 RepID=UPI002221E8E0|nr:hyaluronan and proteoglycan link protein 3-like isoform X1 [Myxocyprinus asiaticus]